MVPARPPRRLDFLTVRETPDGRRLDLADLRWLDPLHLVGVATHALLAHRAGSRLLLTGLPENQAYYAARMHLGRIVELFGGQHDLPEVNERDLRDSLLEIQLLRNPQDVERLTELVYHRVAMQSEPAARALHLALAEVGSNVCQHAQSIGFMAAQTIAEHGVLRFAVADAGVGLLATLAPIGAADDRQAVELALAGERHRQDPSRGFGLPGTVRIITELDGELLLASGLAATRVSPGRNMERRLDAAFQGTIFEGSVPAIGPIRGGGRPRPTRGPAHTGPDRPENPSDAVPAAPEVKQ